VPGSLLGLACLTRLLSSAPRFVPRLTELLLCLSELALQLLQLALKAADFALDSVDPVDRGILRIGHDRQHRRADYGQRTADAISAAGF